MWDGIWYLVTTKEGIELEVELTTIIGDHGYEHETGKMIICYGQTGYNITVDVENMVRISKPHTEKYLWGIIFIQHCSSIG